MKKAKGNQKCKKPKVPTSAAKRLAPACSPLMQKRNVNTTNSSLGGEETDHREQRRPELPVLVQVRLIVLALQKIADPKGSSLKDIRKFLTTVGVIEESTDMRQAMIVALKLGAVARPVWAVKAGLYGRYVQGDGIPIFAGRKSRPKKIRHRSSLWVSSRELSKKSSRRKRKGEKRHQKKRKAKSSRSRKVKRRCSKRRSRRA